MGTGGTAEHLERLALAPPQLPYAEGISAAAIDDHWIALGSARGAVHLFARGEGPAAATLHGLSASIKHLAFWGDELVGADTAGNLWRWQVASGHCVAARHFAGRDNLALQIDRDGIVCAIIDRRVPIYDRQRPSWRDPRVDAAGFVEAHGPHFEAGAGWQVGTERGVLGLGMSVEHVVAAMPHALLVLRRDNGQALRLVQAADLMQQFRYPLPRITAVALDGAAWAVATSEERQEPPFGRTAWRHHVVLMTAAPPSAEDLLPYRPPPAGWHWPWPFS